MTRRTTGLAAAAAGVRLAPWVFDRRDLRADDVALRVTYCGVCHTDVHAWQGEPLYGNRFPLVPGHEFVGVVTEVGDAVTQFTPGDNVAVGNIVDSCGTCEMCVDDREQYCRQRPTLTYGDIDRVDERRTYGGFSSEYVVGERFVYHVPVGLDPAGTAPLMCAGATVWEPLQRWRIGTGSRVGIVGLGGLGHLAVKLAAAMGASVTVFTTSPGKVEAAHALGADDVVLAGDPGQIAAASGSCDLVLDTVAVPHDLAGCLAALRFGGTLCVVGSLDPVTIDPIALTGRLLTVSGGCGRAATTEMLEFCGRHGITADVEVLPASAVNEAFERLRRNDVAFRFSLDMTELRTDG
jgi:uncharacterized zinc-type alcohol dehydrogenase-like protein